MDTWNTTFREPTEDEVSARRALALAISLINAHVPRTTTDIRRDLYDDLGDDAFRKAFQRDRTRLFACGLSIVKTTGADKNALWYVDEDSFAVERALSFDDALMLDCLLLPLASDSSFPFARDLRHALEKIDRSFDGLSVATIPPEARQRNNNLTRIEDCLTRRHVANVRYVRADGSKVTRDLAPYGLFHLRDTAYMVAATVEDGKPQAERAHTYNLDRVQSVKEKARVTYEIPADFDVHDFIVLPFQIGPVLYEATFAVPEKRAAELRLRTAGRGTWSREGDKIVFASTVSNEAAAAAWAIAEDIRPQDPTSLVLCWRQTLERVRDGAR